MWIYTPNDINPEKDSFTLEKLLMVKNKWELHAINASGTLDTDRVSLCQWQGSPSSHTIDTRPFASGHPDPEQHVPSRWPRWGFEFASLPFEPLALTPAYPCWRKMRFRPASVHTTVSLTSSLDHDKCSLARHLWWEGFNSNMLTWAAIAALDRASSLFPCVSPVELAPKVRPGVFFQLALAGTEARGAADWFEGLVPTTRPGLENASGSLEPREQMFPIVRKLGFKSRRGEKEVEGSEVEGRWRGESEVNLYILKEGAIEKSKNWCNAPSPFEQGM